MNTALIFILLAAVIVPALIGIAAKPSTRDRRPMPKPRDLTRR